MVAGILRDVKEYIKRCQKKCKELRNFTQNTWHSWPREVEPWSRVHMNHVYITGGGLPLILVESFLGWPEVIRVPDKKNSTVKQILKVIFSRNDISKSLVSDYTPEFHNEDLSLWLEKIGCKPYKTTPYHPQSIGLTETMVQTVKTGLKAWSQQREKIVFLSRLVLCYHTIPHIGRLEIPSALMGRQISAPITMSYSTNEKVWYKKNKESNPERAELIIQKSHNTAIINREKGNRILAHEDKKGPRVNMKSKMRKKSLQFLPLMIY